MACSGKASGSACVGVGRVPDRQRRHRPGEPVAQVLGRLLRADAERGGLEAGERLGIELEEVGRGRVVEAHAHRPGLVGDVPRLEEGGLLRDVGGPEAAVLDVAGDLAGVRGAAALGAAVGAAPAGERADAGAALVADHVVDVVGVGRAAVGLRPCRGASAGRRGRAAPTGSRARPRGPGARARPPASGSRRRRRRARRSGGRAARCSRGARGRWCRAAPGRRRRRSRRSSCRRR